MSEIATQTNPNQTVKTSHQRRQPISCYTDTCLEPKLTCCFLYKTKTDFLKYGPWLTAAAYYLLKPFQQLFAAQSAANKICSSTLAATICTNQRRQTFAATVCSTVHNQHLQRSPCANKLHKLSAATFAATLCVRDLHRPASETQHLQQTSAATNCRKLFQ